MEQKNVFTLAMFTGVVLLSFLASPVICRPNRGNANNSSNNYLASRHNQQHYDTHYHYSQHLSDNRGDDIGKTNTHHHHHHPHHHSKHGHEHSERLPYNHLQQRDNEAFRLNEGVETDVDENNNISPLHATSSRSHYSPKQRYSQQQRHALPVVSKALSTSTFGKQKTSRSNLSPKRVAEEEYDYDEEEDEEAGTGSGSYSGRHAYLMTTDKKKSSKEKVTEDEALTQAFEKHMRPSGSLSSNVASKPTPKDEVHDVYAYQLPSDLWFVVRYNKNADGQVEKYMNIVDSFTNYLDKLDKDVKTVSVNVKGVETVFRLTTKRNNSSSN